MSPTRKPSSSRTVNGFIFVPCGPSDKQMLLDGFEHLSPDSRYARFMAPKSTLTDRELRYLTEVDGIDHFAIGAIRRHLVSKPEGVGSARFVRLSDQPDTAEPAVTVLDDFHGKGLGSIMLQRLIEAAWERDVRWFCTELLADNTASRRMIESLSPDVTVPPCGGRRDHRHAARSRARPEPRRPRASSTEPPSTSSCPMWREPRFRFASG